MHTHTHNTSKLWHGPNQFETKRHLRTLGKALASSASPEALKDRALNCFNTAALPSNSEQSCSKCEPMLLPPMRFFRVPEQPDFLSLDGELSKLVIKAPPCSTSFGNFVLFCYVSDWPTTAQGVQKSIQKYSKDFKRSLGFPGSFKTLSYMISSEGWAVPYSCFLIWASFALPRVVKDSAPVVSALSTPCHQNRHWVGTEELQNWDHLGGERECVWIFTDCVQTVCLSMQNRRHDPESLKGVWIQWPKSENKDRKPKTNTGPRGH